LREQPIGGLFWSRRPAIVQFRARFTKAYYRWTQEKTHLRRDSRVITPCYAVIGR